MSSITLHYRDGYKGQVAKTLRVKCPIIPKEAIVTEFIELDLDGILLIRTGYAYDFASGPTIDWPEYIKAASLFHDALCQLHQEGYIDDKQRKQADKWFRGILKANGMWWPRWAIWYRGVRIGSNGGTKPKKIHQVKLELPK